MSEIMKKVPSENFAWEFENKKTSKYICGDEGEKNNITHTTIVGKSVQSEQEKKE